MFKEVKAYWLLINLKMKDIVIKTLFLNEHCDILRRNHRLIITFKHYVKRDSFRYFGKHALFSIIVMPKGNEVDEII